MTLKDLRTIVRQQLMQPNQQQLTDEEIDFHINQAQILLNAEGLILRTNASANTVVDQERYSLPTDLVAILRVDYDGKKIKHISWDDINELDIT